MKERLWNCHVVLVPYWLVDVMRSHNEQPTNLTNLEKLQHILTKADLDFYTRRSSTLDEFTHDQPILSAFTKSTYPVPSGYAMGTQSIHSEKPIDCNANYMSSSVSQYVRPTRDGIVDVDHPYLFNLFVISDKLSADPVNGELVLGISLSTNSAANKQQAALDNLSANIELLTKYYGIDKMMLTPLVSKYIGLKRRSLFGNLSMADKMRELT